MRDTRHIDAPMTYDILTGLALFAFVSSITPGPNNLMLMASGANYGFRKTMPHMFGVAIGFNFMIALVGAGLVQLFDMYTFSYVILKWVSIAYLLYLAWKVATAPLPTHDGATGRPFTFLQAALFQWVNPKAWTMALTATTIYAPDNSLYSVGMVVVVFAAVNFPCITIWVVFGQQFKRLLSSPRRLRIFNITMAAVLVATLYSVLYPQAIQPKDRPYVDHVAHLTASSRNL